MSFQFEPSSSATICAMVEAMCWPMSALPQVTVTMPSGAIEYQTLGSKLPARSERLIGAEQAGNGGIAEREAGGGGADEERAAAEIGGFASVRFSRAYSCGPPLGAGVGRGAHVGGGAHDRLLDARIGHAAAEIAVHMRDDFILGRIGILRQQRGRLHDLAGLAVAALRNLLGDPGLLQADDRPWR